MQHIGKKIKELILEKRYSAKDVASQLSVSYQHLYRIFASESVESHYLISLSEILKIPVSAFFDTNGTDEIDYIKKEISNTKELNIALAASLGSAENEKINQVEKLQSKRAILRLIYSRIKQSYSNYYDSFFTYPQDEIKAYFENKFLHDFIHDTLNCYNEILKAVNEAENFEDTKSKKISKESGLELSSTSFSGPITDITVSKVKPAEDEHLTRLEKLQKIQHTISQLKLNDLNATSTKKEIINEINSIIEDFK